MFGYFLGLFGWWPIGRHGHGGGPTPVVLAPGVIVEVTLVQPTILETALVEPSVVEMALVQPTSIESRMIGQLP